MANALHRQNPLSISHSQLLPVCYICVKALLYKAYSAVRVMVIVTIHNENREMNNHFLPHKLHLKTNTDMMRKALPVWTNIKNAGKKIQLHDIVMEYTSADTTIIEEIAGSLSASLRKYFITRTEPYLELIPIQYIKDNLVVLQQGIAEQHDNSILTNDRWYVLAPIQ